MFADREHPHPAGNGLGLGQKARDGRHVAVFHRDPDRGAKARAQRREAAGIRGVGEERLLDEHRQGAQPRDLFHLGQVAIVRRGDEQTIHPRIGHDIGERRAKARAGCKRRGGRAHPRVGLKDRGDLGIWQQGDVAQMLLPHHAAADDAIAKGAHVRATSGARHSALCRG